MSSEIDFYQNALSFTGAILGIIAFFWKFWDFLYANVFSHLQLDLNVTKESSSLLKFTSEIENKGSSARKINYAFLLISPEGCGLKESLEELSKGTMKFSNKSTPVILKYLLENERDKELSSPDNNYLLLPLKYYYQEQIHIGNERIKYSISQPESRIQSNNTYTVRFVIVSLHMMNTYLRYRSTSDLLINLK